MRSPVIRAFRTLMRNRRLSQRDAARELGIGQATLSRILGDNDPRVSLETFAVIQKKMLELIEHDEAFYRTAAAAFDETLRNVRPSDARRYLNRWLAKK